MLGLNLGVALGSQRDSKAPIAVTQVDSGVSSADLSTYTFAGKTLGKGLIVIAGVIRAGTAVTISSITIAGQAAAVQVSSVNGSTSAAFIACVENTAASGDIVINLSAAAARCGVDVFKITGHSQSAAYLTGTATRAATAGTMTPNLIGAISKGVVIGVGMNGLGPGHRIAAGSKLVNAQTNYNVTLDCQAGVSTWTGLDAGIDTEMEVTGVAVSMAAAAAAFR